MTKSYKRKIYYHDTDCGGIVYYANYLKFLEEARTDFFEQLNLDVCKIAEEDEALFVVARQEIDYRLPSYYGEILDILTWIVELGKVKIVFGYEIRNKNGQKVVDAKTLMFCVDKNIKKRQIPTYVFEALKSCIKE